MKTSIPIKVSIGSDNADHNPIFNSLQAGVDDQAAGSFLIIDGMDLRENPAQVAIDWEEWDELVKVVAKYRSDWEWK